MLRHLRTLIFLASLVVSAPSADRDGDGRSSKKTSSEVERSLERFLGSYYDEHFPAEEATSPSQSEDPEDIYDTMQGDQPPEDEAKSTVAGKIVPDIEYIRAMRNRSVSIIFSCKICNWTSKNFLSRFYFCFACHFGVRPRRE